MKRNIAEIEKLMQSEFNNSRFSDFIVRDRSGNKIYVHKFMLCSLEYFKNFFSSKVGGDKTEIVVESIEAARILLEYVYYEYWSLSSHTKITLQLFIDVVILSKEWLLFSELKHALYNVAMRFGDYCNIENFYYVHDLYINFHDYENWDRYHFGKELIKKIAKNLENNHEILPEDVLDYHSFNQMLSEEIKTKIIVRHAAFHRLNPPSTISLDYLQSAVKQYYESSITKLKPHEIKIICQATKIFRTGSNNDYFDVSNKKNGCSDILCVTTMQPFVFIFYKECGEIKITDNRIEFKAIWRCVYLEDKLLINKKEYTVKKIIWNDTITNKCIPYNNYIIELDDTISGSNLLTVHKIIS